MMTQWGPLIREYVGPYFFCRSLKSAWGGSGLRRLSRLPITGRDGRRGISLGPCTGDLSFSCSASKARATSMKTHRHIVQSISAAEGPDGGVRKTEHHSEELSRKVLLWSSFNVKSLTLNI